jgi:hypothetical protein
MSHTCIQKFVQRSLVLLVVSVGVVACGGEASLPECAECIAAVSGLKNECDRCDPVEFDSDGDGIVDSKDQCPTQPETYNGYQDADGCPDTAPVLTIPGSIAGTWSGPASLTTSNVAYANGGGQTVTVTVAPGGQSGTLSGFCPDGSGVVTLTPTSTSDGGKWSGIYSCPPGPWGACDSPVVPLYANMLVFSVVVKPSGAGVIVQTDGSVSFTDRDDEHFWACERTGSFTGSMTGGR